MAALDFRVLGPLEVRRDGQPIAIPAPRQRALLGLLLLHANEPVSQDELIDQLWGEDAPPTARASLQNQVHALRGLLGAATLERKHRGYVLHVEPGELDLERFERLVAQARGAEPREKARKLRAALALWRGPPLVEFPTEPFAQFEITRLEEERLTALEDRIDVDLALGEHADLVPELESLVERYPLRERIWGQLMLALYRTGRQGEALAAYRRAHQTFVDELGGEPGVELRELQRAILVQDAALDDPERQLGWTLERAAALLPLTGQERAESLYEYALALFRIGEQRRAISTFEAAARTAETAGDVSVAERARLYLAYVSTRTEGASQAGFLAEAERAAERFEARGDREGLLLALKQQSQILLLLGVADDAAQRALQAAAVASDVGDTYEEAKALTNRAAGLAFGSTPVSEAIPECEAVHTDGERRGIWDLPPLPLGLLLALGSLYGQAGRTEDARAILERAIFQARKAGLVWFLSGATHELGKVEFMAGNLADAAENMRAAYALIETAEDQVTKPAIAAELACVLALEGDVQEAEELALAARAMSTGGFFAETCWRRALALVAAHESRFEEAIRLSEEATARANASDSLTFRGQTLEEAATVRRFAGDAVRATEALTEALALYGRKGNVVGAERVRQALG
jgi:DNA-binding SARP family transcriptional activator